MTQELKKKGTDLLMVLVSHLHHRYFQAPEAYSWAYPPGSAALYSVAQHLRVCFVHQAVGVEGAQGHVHLLLTAR